MLGLVFGMSGFLVMSMLGLVFGMSGFLGSFDASFLSCILRLHLGFHLLQLLNVGCPPLLNGCMSDLRTLLPVSKQQRGLFLHSSFHRLLDIFSLCNCLCSMLCCVLGHTLSCLCLFVDNVSRDLFCNFVSKHRHFCLEDLIRTLLSSNFSNLRHKIFSSCSSFLLCSRLSFLYSFFFGSCICLLYDSFGHWFCFLNNLRFLGNSFFLLFLGSLCCCCSFLCLSCDFLLLFLSLLLLFLNLFHLFSDFFYRFLHLFNSFFLLFCCLHCHFLLFLLLLCCFRLCCCLCCFFLSL